MDVTLIVGNGFDLNIGLPTSYSDFYHYYLNVASGIQEADFIKQKIKDSPVNWSDLEKSLGDITSEFSDNIAGLDAAFQNVRNELEKYLKAVDAYRIPQLNTYAPRFLRDILEIDKLLDNKPKREYIEFVNSFLNKDIVLNVVNFNYTSTIEKIRDINPSLSIGQRKIEFGNVVHVHQDLDTGIIMGVNDGTQISNEAFQKSFDIRSLMVKPFINEEFAAGNDEKCVEMITSSDVIVLFGTSFGVTDRKWWNLIAHSVNDRKQRVIYCPFETGPVQPLNATDVIRKNQNFKISLSKKLASSEPTKQQNLIEKIYPIRNNHLFDFGVTSKVRLEVRREVVKSLV